MSQDLVKAQTEDPTEHRRHQQCKTHRLPAPAHSLDRIPHGIESASQPTVKGRAMTTHAHVRWTTRPKTPCRSAADIRFRLSAGARTIILDTDGVLDLDDSHFAGTTQTWTMRIAGVSQVRINLAKKLPQRITIVATDSSTVQATGVTELHAYTNATVAAFDDCKVTGHNNATINACDRVVVVASENATVNAYDASTVHAAGHATVNATDNTRVVLHDNASAVAQRGVTVHGPSRHNLTVHGSGTAIPLVQGAANDTAI